MDTTDFKSDLIMSLGSKQKSTEEMERGKALENTSKYASGKTCVGSAFYNSDRVSKKKKKEREILHIDN